MGAIVVQHEGPPGNWPGDAARRGRRTKRSAARDLHEFTDGEGWSPKFVAVSG
jgi:hypothetical protein